MDHTAYALARMGRRPDEHPPEPYHYGYVLKSSPRLRDSLFQGWCHER